MKRKSEEKGKKLAKFVRTNKKSNVVSGRIEARNRELTFLFIPCQARALASGSTSLASRRTRERSCPVTRTGPGESPSRGRPSRRESSVSSTSKVASSTTTTSAPATTSLARNLHSDALLAEAGSVQVTHGILCISGIFELDESETGRLARDPHALQLADLAKRIFHFPLVDLGVQVTNVHFTITCHSCDSATSKTRQLMILQKLNLSL